MRQGLRRFLTPHTTVLTRNRDTIRSRQYGTRQRQCEVNCSGYVHTVRDYVSISNSLAAALAASRARLAGNFMLFDFSNEINRWESFDNGFQMNISHEKYSKFDTKYIFSIIIDSKLDLYFRILPPRCWLQVDSWTIERRPRWRILFINLLLPSHCSMIISSRFADYKNS